MVSAAMAPESALSMKVDMYISGRNLKSLDMFSKSDPVCVLSEFNTQSKSWVKLGKTEMLKNERNPDFKTRFTVSYFFEKAQKLKFDMVDDDGSGSTDHIGSVETTMGAVMGARGQVFQSELTHGNDSKNRGQIIVRAEGVQESKL